MYTRVEVIFMKKGWIFRKNVIYAPLKKNFPKKILRSPPPPLWPISASATGFTYGLRSQVDTIVPNNNALKVGIRCKLMQKMQVKQIDIISNVPQVFERPINTGSSYIVLGERTPKRSCEFGGQRGRKCNVSLPSDHRTRGRFRWSRIECSIECFDWRKIRVRGGVMNFWVPLWWDKIWISGKGQNLPPQGSKWECQW